MQTSDCTKKQNNLALNSPLELNINENRETEVLRKLHPHLGVIYQNRTMIKTEKQSFGIGNEIIFKK
jgi:hypothetical protein